MRLAQQKRNERVHSGGREQDSRIVFRQERRGANAFVSAHLKKLLKQFA
jgi:hypothetical protein